jgi:hypothetical protein
MYDMNFWSRFYRKFRCSIDYLGVEFYYKGDSVIWLWPWKRTSKNRKWLSISFECSFNTLKELDEYWDGYEKAIMGFKSIDKN